MLCPSSHRSKLSDLKAHPFFYGIDWEKLRNGPAPFVPQLQSITDTSYFPTDDLNVDHHDEQMQGGVSGINQKDLAFVGYTFKRWDTIRNDL